MTCIIIDDEPLARAGMELHLKNLPQLQLKGSFSNPIDAITMLQQNEIDLVFLDINMPEITGLDFAKSLINSPLIIFVTAYPQYALDSYELETVDYLVKPIRFERLVKAVNKAQHYLNLLHSKDLNDNQIELVNHDFIYIKADRKYFKIHFKDILYIEGLKDYVIIHTQERKVVTAMNLKTIFDQLPPTLFARISKSYIVNTGHIVSFDTFTVYLNNIELPVGNNFKDDFFRDFVEAKVIKR
jgi:two-component system, LytTR family, response regulator